MPYQSYLSPRLHSVVFNLIIQAMHRGSNQDRFYAVERLWWSTVDELGQARLKAEK